MVFVVWCACENIKREELIPVRLISGKGKLWCCEVNMCLFVFFSHGEIVKKETRGYRYSDKIKWCGREFGSECWIRWEIPVSPVVHVAGDEGGPLPILFTAIT